MNSSERASLREMSVVLLRVIVGGTFIFASIDKIIEPQTFAASIANYKIVSGNMPLLVATILPWVELLSGLGLLWGVFVRGSALLTLTMLAVFTILISSAMLRGLDISCGCFTQDPAAGKIGWTKISENLLLIALNFLVFRIPTGRFSLQHRIGQRRRTGKASNS